MIPHPKAWLAFSVLLLLAGLAPAAGSEADLRGDEKTLKEAGIDASGPALLEFFRTRTFTEADRQKAVVLVRQLGHESFELREQASRDLVILGHFALPPLLKAQNDLDPEVRRRADECVEAIHRGSERILLAAAAHILAQRKPADAARVLLTYVPCSPDDTVTTAVLDALEAVRLRDGQIDPLLPAALSDKDPARRAAAAHVLAKTSPEHRAAVRRLFADPDVSVRARAALSLVHAGDKAALPALMALLSDAPPDLAWEVENLLFRVAAEKAPTATLSEGLHAGNRRRCQEAWLAWWDANKDQIDLAQLARPDREVGVKLVCELEGGAQNGGRVVEFGPDDRVRWQFDNVSGPIDVQLLPNGRVLIAEINANRVTERDRSGKIYFTKMLDDSPMTCQRLPNGNTFIATYTQILEVTRDGRTVFSYAKPEQRIYCAQKLPNGHILYVTSGGQVVELGQSGREVRTIPAGDTSNWGSVEALPNGNLLVCRCSKHEVVEIDGAGKVVWRCEAQWPTWACKRANGRVMVACAHSGQVLEFDRDGKEVWKQKLTGRPCRVRRY